DAPGDRTVDGGDQPPRLDPHLLDVGAERVPGQQGLLLGPRLAATQGQRDVGGRARDHHHDKGEHDRGHRRASETTARPDRHTARPPRTITVVSMAPSWADVVASLATSAGATGCTGGAAWARAVAVGVRVRVGAGFRRWDEPSGRARIARNITKTNAIRTPAGFIAPPSSRLGRLCYRSTQIDRTTRSAGY